MLSFVLAAKVGKMNKIWFCPSRCSYIPCWTSMGWKDESHSLLQYRRECTRLCIPITRHMVNILHPGKQGLDLQLQIEKPYTWSTSTSEAQGKFNISVSHCRIMGLNSSPWSLGQNHSHSSDPALTEFLTEYILVSKHMSEWESNQGTNSNSSQSTFATSGLEHLGYGSLWIFRVFSDTGEVRPEPKGGSALKQASNEE